MVKPPRTMQPEANQDLSKAGRATTKAFGEDSFYNYMARKIDLQRKQVGFQLPPPVVAQPQPSVPLPPAAATTATTSVVATAAAAAEDTDDCSMAEMMKRLSSRHDNNNNNKRRTRKRKRRNDETDHVSAAATAAATTKSSITTTTTPSTAMAMAQGGAVGVGCCSPVVRMNNHRNHHRPDLFLLGIVVLINGYTQPDSDTLQRMLQKHGGDVERYETTRVTHVIAESMSAAKAKQYYHHCSTNSRNNNNKKKPLVVLPGWIVDCVQQQRLLSCGQYLLPQVYQQQQLGNTGQQQQQQQQSSLTSFFGTAPAMKNNSVSPRIIPTKNSNNNNSSGQKRRRSAAVMTTTNTQKSSSTSTILAQLELKEEAPKNHAHHRVSLFPFQQEQQQQRQQQQQHADVAVALPLMVGHATSFLLTQKEESPPLLLWSPDDNDDDYDDVHIPRLENVKSKKAIENNDKQQDDDDDDHDKAKKDQSSSSSSSSSLNLLTAGCLENNNKKPPPPPPIEEEEEKQQQQKRQIGREKDNDEVVVVAAAAAAATTARVSISTSLSISSCAVVSNNCKDEPDPKPATSTIATACRRHAKDNQNEQQQQQQENDTEMAASASSLSSPLVATNQKGRQPCTEEKQLLVTTTTTTTATVPQKGQDMITMTTGDEKQVSPPSSSPSSLVFSPSHGSGRTDDKYINGRIRTVGTDPNFLQTFFHNSRLSFLGSFQQRVKATTTATTTTVQKLPPNPAHRVVFHVDMDSFFCAVVLRHYPEYLDKPVAISHAGKNNNNNSNNNNNKSSTSECATCNYEARKFGITKGMYLGRAKSLCPNLIVLQYDFEGYEEVADQVADILHRYAVLFNGSVETVSCDEAYMELFIPPVLDINKNDPKDTDDISTKIGAESQQQYHNDNDRRRHDTLGQVAERIRKEIFDTTQCTASIGIATNKFLAKLATDKNKPNGYFIGLNHHELLTPTLKLYDLHGIGYRLHPKLTEAGLSTIQDVLDMGDVQARETLGRLLGPQLGKKIWFYCHGMDDRPVKPAERKTIGAECNYGVLFQGGTYGVDYMIEGLAREVEKRMEHVTVRGIKVTLKVKQRKKDTPPPHKFLGHGHCHNHSKSFDASKPTREWSVLAKLGKKLFDSMKIPTNDVRGMGLIVSKLSVDGKEGSRQGIQQWFQPAKQAGKDCTSPQVLNDHSQSKGSEPVARDKASDDMLDSVDLAVNLQLESEDDDHDSVQILDHAGDSSIPFDDDDCDIALPALSQIRMSQVQVLPSPLRRQIKAKMEMERKSKARAAVMAEAEAAAVFKPRFRQTDVQRVMRLAAVKAGHQNAGTDDARRLSLGQLESLPFEVQLQVTNNDELGVGTLSRQSHTHRKKQQRLLMTIKRAKSALPLSTRSKKAESPARHQAPLMPSIEFDSVEDPNEFFQQNVLPLSVFLDENSPDSEAAFNHVLNFFRLLMDENLHWDVARLLRSIRNRSDGWGGATKVFQDIFEDVNNQVVDATGMQLDID